MKKLDRVYIILMGFKPLLRLIIIIAPILTKQDFSMIISFSLISLIWGGYDLLQKRFGFVSSGS